MDLYQELSALVSTLETRGIDYALCGGMALAIHGAPRATQDIDLLARQEDLDRIREAARGCGFVFESLPMDFASSGITIYRFTKLIENVPLMLDVLLAEGPLAAVWQTRLTVALETGHIKVVSKQGLVTMKLAAGRPQDIADVKRLAELDRG
ncbi:MAG TPA: nucleotidyl transferase AbiEii/AbiGii toxin family protein [Polyangia bacterium]